MLFIGPMASRWPEQTCGEWCARFVGPSSSHSARTTAVTATMMIKNMDRSERERNGKSAVIMGTWKGQAETWAHTC
eukprot:425844-Pyramimonas_sp.AAC.1